MKEIGDGNFEQEKSQAGQELTLTERGALVDAWSAMVMAKGMPPLEAEHWNNEQTRQWLSDTLFEDTDQLIKDWKLTPDPDIVAALAKAESATERAKLELQFMEGLKQQLNAHHGQSGRSASWDSWPRIMRQVEDANCVGISLLAQRVLKQAGIEAQFGNPFGHIMNMVKLSDGRYCYADFTNRTIKPISTQEREIKGTTVLEINEPDIAYRLMPLIPDRRMPASILGNLSVIYHHRTTRGRAQPDDEESSKERAESGELIKKFPMEFLATDWHTAIEKLYPEDCALDDSEEMVVEGQRVGRIESAQDLIFHRVEKRVQESGLSAQDFFQVWGDNFENIQALIYDHDQSSLEKVPPELRGTLSALADQFSKLRDTDPELYLEVRDKIFARWRLTFRP